MSKVLVFKMYDGQLLSIAADQIVSIEQRRYDNGMGKVDQGAILTTKLCREIRVMDEYEGVSLRWSSALGVADAGTD